MATLYTQQSSNVRRTWLLMAGFLLLIIFIGWFASYFYGQPAILYVAVAFSLIMNFGSYWWSDKIALAVSGAKPLTREDNVELWRLAENLSISAGLPLPKLYLIDDPAPNAFATGRDKHHASIAVTSGLLSILNRSELEGVLAHELSHIGNRDILLQTIVVTLVGLVAIVADMMFRSLAWSSGRQSDRRGGGLLVVVGLLLMLLSPVVAQIIQLAISRRREFLADASGALLTRYPEALASALQKISAYSGGVRRANKATAHLYIANPLATKKSFGLSGLFLTHPPVAERIKALVGEQR